MTEVKKQRLLHDFTQEYVAKHIGISQTIYSQKEANKVKFSIKEALLMANLYNTTVEELFKDLK